MQVNGVSGFINTAISCFPGTRSSRICGRLVAMSLAWLVKPVTFAPGCLRLATKPAPIVRW
jgi:hypothetical protein